MMITDENDGDTVLLLPKKLYIPGSLKLSISVVENHENKPRVHLIKQEENEPLSIQAELKKEENNIANDGTIMSTFPNSTKKASLVQSIRRDTEQTSEEEEVFYEASPVQEDKEYSLWPLLIDQESVIRYVPSLIEEKRPIEVMFEPVNVPLLPNNAELDLGKVSTTFEYRCFGPLYNIPEFDEDISDPISSLLCILDMEFSGIPTYRDERSYWEMFILWIKNNESDDKLKERYYNKYPWTRYLTKFEQ